MSQPTFVSCTRKDSCGRDGARPPVHATLKEEMSDRNVGKENECDVFVKKKFANLPKKKPPLGLLELLQLLLCESTRSGHFIAKKRSEC
jgi:hypothetical protein